MPVWGNVEELLAQVVEEVAVLTSDMRRKGDPRRIPRPGDGVPPVKHVPAGSTAARRGPNDGLTQLLSAATGQGRVRVPHV